VSVSAVAIDWSGLSVAARREALTHIVGRTKRLSRAAVNAAAGTGATVDNCAANRLICRRNLFAGRLEATASGGSQGMKLASYVHAGKESFGLVLPDGLFDLKQRLGGADIVNALTGAAHAQTLALSKEARAEIAFDDVRFLQPIPKPGKIICVGINYASRPGEHDVGRPAYPSLFMRTPLGQSAHGEALMRPPESEQFDYEGEIAIVVGKRGRRIPKVEGLSYIAGYSCFNEGSVRDWMKHGVYNVTAGKNFERSGAFGPWITTPDEIRDPHDMRITTRINGEVRQDDTTANMIFPFEELIAYISTYTTIEPGDVIVTGTPTGAGIRFTPPKWLKAGDVVEIEVEGVGVLRNVVADEA
jgi:2-keto-4-pentenoate hydratase/2-oxohepta-3-ene-1,7-dioic acid hydratase in catechol pathway